MKTRLGQLIALVAACAAVALVMSAPAASAAEPGECSSITGSGSSLQNLAQTTIWIPGFHNQKPHKKIECESKLKEPTVTYNETSSGKGLACWGVKEGKIELSECGNGKELDAYIDTDVAPEGPASKEGTQLFNIAKAGNQNSKEPNQVTAVPVAQSAVAVIVSLPAECELEGVTAFRVKGGELAKGWATAVVHQDQFKLFHGRIIVCIPRLQKKAAKLFVRSKASGTTAGFKRFLDQVDPTEWGSFVTTAAEAESTNWPENAGVEKVNGTGTEEADKVYETPESEGYADLADARAAGFTLAPKRHTVGQQKFYSFFVEVQNKEGTEPTYASPEISPEATEQKEGANCLTAKYENEAQLKVGQDQDWSKARQVNELEGSNEGPYPICTLTFDIAWEHYKFFKEETGEGKPGYKTDTGTANTVLDYFEYIVSTGQEGEALDAAHYAPLPENIKTLAKAGVNKTNIGL